MDYQYEPKILFLRGCFLENCNSIEDLFYEKILSDGQIITENSNDIVYDKIPQVFTSVDSWIQTTNLKCWNCDCTFDTLPIFIPLSINTDDSMDTLGNFCLWGCAARYINTILDYDVRWEAHALLRTLYRTFTGKKIEEIIPAEPKTEMIQYGGKKPSKLYIKQLKELNTSYDTAIKHNSIKMINHTKND